MKKKIIITISILAITCLLFVTFQHEPETKVHANQPDIYAKSGIAIDATTGEILYGKNEQTTAQPGSLVKLMTALLLLEQMKPEDEVTITQHALDTEEGTKKIKLRAGEKLKRDEALHLMLVISVDPVAQSVAEQLAGSKEKFAALMNRRAKELGSKNPSFKNASGIEAWGQRMSSYDLALIAKELLKHPEAVKAMRTVTTPIHTSLQDTTITNNGRKDLFHDPYALASKSGRTDIGGYTLAAVYEKDGKRVISIVLTGDEEHLYKDASIMAHYSL